jgi:ketosteroid isomerase-like protein
MPPDQPLELQIRQLKARVDTLTAIEEIHSLRYRFHQYVNDNEWDRIGALFTPDAYLDYAHLGQVSGRPAIHRFFADIPSTIEQDAQATTTAVKQFVHAHDVRVSGDRATGLSYFEAKPVYHGRSFVVAGKFIDSYARLDGVWLFARVSLVLHWMVPLEEGWAQRDRIKMTL